jgi:sec-independent protein translocase protein TatA
MFGISFEHILIVGVVLLIFGPKRLPELGLTMGKAIKNFKDSISGIEEANFKRIAETEKQNKAPVTPAPATTETTTTTTAST